LANLDGALKGSEPLFCVALITFRFCAWGSSYVANAMLRVLLGRSLGTSMKERVDPSKTSFFRMFKFHCSWRAQRVVKFYGSRYRGTVLIAGHCQILPEILAQRSSKEGVVLEILRVP